MLYLDVLLNLWGDVSKAPTNHLNCDGICNLFTAKLVMLYYCFTDIVTFMAVARVIYL